MGDEDSTRRANPERQQLAREASRVVQQAASILESELSAGAATAASMERRLAEERKVDPDEFKALAQRVRNDVHDLISIAAELFSELQTDEVQGLAKRLATDAHDVVDTTMNVVDRAPQAANQFVRLGFMGPAPPGDEPGPLDPQRPDAVPGDEPGPPRPDAVPADELHPLDAPGPDVVPGDEPAPLDPPRPDIDPR